MPGKLLQVALLSLLYSFGLAQNGTSSSYYTSPTVYPSPNTTGAGGWQNALEQAQSFVSQLNLTEKAYMVTGVVGPCVGNIAPIPRLNFTGLCMQDGPTAIRIADYASVFPAGITTASTWDKTLFFQRAAAIGQEFKDKGAHVILGPVAGPLGRVALGGRNWEGFSPDPYLTGVAFALSVEGIQSVGTQACGKHYIGNEQETQRNPTTNEAGDTILAISSNIDDRTMHELYLWPFADAVKSGIASVMCSYNRVNQTYSCENSKMLNGVLKDELGFQGYVVSDWAATHSGLQSINGGLDMDMPGPIEFGVSSASFFGGNITTAVQNGSLPESRLDDMILRVMTPYFYLGQQNYPSIDPSTAGLNGFNPANSNYTWNLSGETSRDVRAGHAQVIHDIAAQGIVLLKNENGTLPLKSPKLIGVFGNDAADLTTGMYNYAVFNYPASPGYDIGTCAVGGGSGQGRFTSLVAPLEAIKQRAMGEGAAVQYVLDNRAAIQPEGGGVLGPPAGRVSPTPDVCLVFLKTWVSEGYDRIGYEADWNSTQLVANVTSFCNNTVVITHSGGINTMPWADNENVTAILAAHFPGDQSGNSLVSVLWGDVNPSGHLPYTIALEESDYNTKVINITNDNNTDPNAWQDNFSEGLYIDYRHFDEAEIEPLYEFGYGLSYTTFNMSSLSIQPASNESVMQYPDVMDIQPGGNPNLYTVLATVSVSISNTGDIAGSAVPQLYVSLPTDFTPEGTPVKVLRGFDKYPLSPGAEQLVSFALTRRDLSYWDIDAQDWSLPIDGAFTIRVGWSSRDLPLEGPLALTVAG